LPTDSTRGTAQMGKDMQFKRRSFVLLVISWSGILLFLSSCNFVMASNSSSQPLSGQISPATPLPAPPLQATPGLQADIEATMQQRVTEILTPSPRPDVIGPEAASRKATPTPAPEPVRMPAVVPAGDFKAEYYLSGFACTGNMRPAIDCGDEALLLKPPFPEALMIGDIISFTPDISCRYYKNHHISKARLIIAIRVEEDITYYTTKGDATLNPDSCEITIEQIDGKVVEIRKGIRSQDIIDTSQYDLAKARVGLL
jgi:hypothetical protein